MPLVASIGESHVVVFYKCLAPPDGYRYLQLPSVSLRAGETDATCNIYAIQRITRYLAGSHVHGGDYDFVRSESRVCRFGWDSRVWPSRVRFLPQSAAGQTT